MPAHPWDGYLIGPENALAQAGAMALARGETAGVSPLVVHGPAGSGKSRLLAGLVAERLLRRPESAVAHLEAEAFAAACAEASGRPGGWAEVRDRFRRLDLFVLDDLHALERAPWAMEELSHTLDALDEAGAAVAVAARTGPGPVVGLAGRGWSTGWSAGSRSGSTRPRSSRAAATCSTGPGPRGLALPAEVVEPMAEAADGYRTLDGWLAQLGLAGPGRAPRDRPRPRRADPGGRPGRRSARRSTRSPGPWPRKFGLRLRDLRGPTRRAVVAEARHLAMHLARLHTPLSFRAIGDYFGGRDPATVRHACKAAADRLAADPALAAACSALARGWGMVDDR